MSSRAVGRDRTRRPRGKNRLLQAYSDVFNNALSGALEGKHSTERINVGHKREIEKINTDIVKMNRDAVRESRDTTQGIENTESQIRYENQRLSLLRKRQEDEARKGKPTEVVDEQIVNANRRASELWNTKVSLTQRQQRIKEDLKESLDEKTKEAQQEQEDYKRRLREGR